MSPILSDFLLIKEPVSGRIQPEVMVHRASMIDMRREQRRYLAAGGKRLTYFPSKLILDEMLSMCRI
jgi:hypothetical protein